MVVTFEDIVSIIDGAATSVETSSIKGTDSLRDAGLDSLDSMTLFLGIEEKFDISIPDEDIDSLDTINDIVVYLKAK